MAPLFAFKMQESSHLHDYSDGFVASIGQSIFSLTKVSVASALATTRFAQMLDDNGDLKGGLELNINLNYSYHANYPIIECKEK